MSLEVSDFMPYTFQILALMLESTSSVHLSSRLDMPAGTAISDRVNSGTSTSTGFDLFRAQTKE